MAFNMILNIDGINDPSGSPLPIEVLSYSTGLNQTVSSATGRGSGKVQFHELVIRKHIDRASPRLFSATATGAHIKSATLNFLPAVQFDASTVPFLKFHLTEVLISSINYSGNEHGDTAPLEEVSLNYLKFEIVFGDIAGVG